MKSAGLDLGTRRDVDDQVNLQRRAPVRRPRSLDLLVLSYLRQMEIGFDEDSDEDIVLEDDIDDGGIDDDDGPAAGAADDDDALEAVCDRFEEAWVRREPPAVLLGICEQYEGCSGHLLLHPCESISRQVFSPPWERNWGRVEGVGTHQQRRDFFQALFAARPSLRQLQSPESGVTLLHVALYHDASLEWIRLVSCRDVVTYQDASGRTPLYLACHKSQPGVKQYLFELDVDRAAVRMTDAEGQLPLHLACQHNPVDPFVDQLIQAYPEGLSHRHSKGVTPVMGAFWHQTNSEGKLHRLLGWVTQQPESIRAFNNSNMETALACACRQVYGTRGDNRDGDDDNLRLCGTLIREYPVALAMTVTMTFPRQRHVSLPYPLQIAKFYGRHRRYVHALEVATLQMLRALVELVLHPTFSSLGWHGRLRTHAMEAVERHGPVIRGGELGGDARVGPDSPSGMVVSRRLAAMAEHWQVEHTEVNLSNQHAVEWFPEGLCTDLFCQYDARNLLKTDETFRDALTALYRMNQPPDRDLDARSVIDSTCTTLESHLARLANAGENLTALFVRVREFLPGLKLPVRAASK